jgi:hypothetical protein
MKLIPGVLIKYLIGSYIIILNKSLYNLTTIKLLNY